ncbi:lysosomal acid glucosylceramidase-like [Diadema antillarum]|uniref:lysosomal acid glucosylceramidase-like n=1 Tax=Diadema antillarum TaxID=105358 RepID=UPI003A83D40D
MGTMEDPWPCRWRWHVNFCTCAGIFLSVFLINLTVTCTLGQISGNGNGTFYPCNVKKAGDSFVCQCNSTYCDTIESYLPLETDRATVFTSSKASDRFKKTIVSLSATANSTGRYIQLTVNTSAVYQKVMGFGGATTDSAGLSIRNLSAAAQTKLIRAYFSPDGIEYTFSRINVGTCDFSQRPYSLCESENDFELANFSLADEDVHYKIPILQEAMEVSVRPLKFFCTAWSPPKWMKTSGTYRYRGKLIGEPGGKYYKTLALYYAKFIKGYANHSVPLWGMTVQNEPFAGGIKDQPNACLYLTPELERDFVKLDLGPTLEAQGLGNITIMMLDDQRFELPDWPVRVLGDKDAAKYIKGIAVHWYWDKQAPPLKLDLTNQLFPDYFILYTEACQGTSEVPGQKVTLGKWTHGEAYTQSIIENMSHWVRGWLDWNIALNIQGGPSWIDHKLNAPIIVDAEYDVFYKNPMYYHLGHFSKFVLPDSFRANLTIQQQDENLEAIAFLRPDGLVAMVLLNTQDKSVPVSIYDAILDSYINTDVPARSVQTYLWRATKS